MLNVILSLIQALIVFAAFFWGVWCGSHFSWKKIDRQKPVDAEFSPITDADPVQMTEEEKQSIKDQQKALEQCMSYSAEMAYGTQKQ